MYIATTTLWGTKYTARGATPREAVENLNIKNPKGKMVLSMYSSESKQEREKIMSGGLVARLFSQSKTMKEIALKNVSLMFQGL